MTRVFSGVKPTGSLQLGNYLGAIRRWAADQPTDTDRRQTLYPIVDLHALTVEHDPAELRARTFEAAGLLLACGIDPDRSLVFAQSHVPAHTELTWLMESTVHVGELERMVQYKEKSAGKGPIRTSLLTYPALMAADILVYQVDEVPVGDDQNQHVELARHLAQRFNHRYGEIFTVPRAVLPEVAARVMDLSDPAAKMGKSTRLDSPGVVRLLDPPDVVRRKVMRAVTDTGRDVRYDPPNQPGVANLLDILAACTDGDPAALAGAFSGYGRLKAAVADAVVAVLEPIQARYAELAADPVGLRKVLAQGAEKASALAAGTLARAKEAIGLLPPL
jgi:tryptophanyl-tRNA synthetase